MRMRTRRGATTLSLLMVVTLGCMEATGPTSGIPTGPAIEAAPDPVFNFANGPANPGPLIARYTIAAEDIVFLILFDFERSLMTTSTGDDGYGPFDCADATTTFEPLHVQEVNNPTGPISFVLKGDEVFHRVYDLTGVAALDCALLTNATGHLLAEGTGPVMQIDNDYFISETRANAFNFRINAQLASLVDGSAVGLHVIWGGAVLPTGVFQLFRSEIRLNPDPR